MWYVTRQGRRAGCGVTAAWARRLRYPYFAARRAEQEKSDDVRNIGTRGRHGRAGGLAGLAPAAAQTLDKVSFGTNWVAEAEHGGFYQAVADGTYRRYGLDVTIVPGGPQVNNRILLPVGKLDFFMSANTLQAFDAVEQNVPTVVVAAMFQKDPQVLIAHPGPGDRAASRI